MQNRIRVMFCAALCVLVIAMVVSPDGAMAQQDVRAAIEDGNKQFSAAFSRGDGKAVGAPYTATAQAFPPNGDIVQNSEAIGRFCREPSTQESKA